ncbi:MAG: 50S ribosomal protein L18 [candidate division WS6 bacterium OLB20]|uniref:Large ribosomal subunit protein uL18 n=1 Tax=candidate division WS6 bacterium OLB20 TaxID=1617426 RepID=A0A136LX37_9BACT|nr:MAG: 50S ribosomal protein L18 [candidate division WS6 bacterium OLB20]
MKNDKRTKRIRRKRSIRGRISGTASVPRLTVYRSNSHIYAQIIDDVAQVTLASASDTKIDKGNATERAQKVGQEVAKAAMGKKIEKVVFDRNGYKYHGRVKALADAAREAGLKF